MKSVRIAVYELEIDYEKTLSYYESLPLIGEEEHCECIYCQNYALATACFPRIVKTLLSEMGVDPKKDAEVSHLYMAKNNMHMYVADYRVFGKVLKKPNVKMIDIFRENDENYFSVGFENVHVLENDEIMMDLYIDSFLPWLLKEDPE